MMNDANFAYRQSEALTSDPVGLVVVLYDILLQDLHHAVAALAEGDIETRTRSLQHSMLVLGQLQGTLDFEKGGVVAENLDRFYNFIRAKLLEGQIKASSEILEQQITFVSSIRDAWRQVRIEQAAAASPAAPEAMSIVAGASPDEASSAAQWSA